MIDIDTWMASLTDKLKDAFGERLVFVGMQGSYRRGEAHEGSDIDAVVIFDQLSLADLKGYREILATMPEHEKACGFVGDRQTLFNWPRHELFQFQMDTSALYGSSDELLPEISRQDIMDSVKTGAAGIYHACCHSFVHDEGYAACLKEFYKGTFFLLQAIYYLRSGAYIHSKKELLSLLEGEEREILSLSMNWDSQQDVVLAAPEPYAEKLIAWCAGAIN